MCQSGCKYENIHTGDCANNIVLRGGMCPCERQDRIDEIKERMKKIDEEEKELEREYCALEEELRQLEVE